MKTFAILAMVLAAAACQPQSQPERQASAEPQVRIVTDAVLVRQGVSQARQDALRTLLLGTWTCKAIAEGVNITMTTDFRADGTLHAVMNMLNDQLNLNVDAEGKWALTGFNLKQSFTSLGDFTGTLAGAPVSAEANVGLKEAVMDLSPDPEEMTMSEGKFTLLDGEGVLTTCTQ